ncbi:MAG: hypothetical protein LBF70_00970 [Holosporales bacterium]|jgi:hypothetical protein|nr:hypothetical protein [Holosporales bacterium]
MVSLKGFGKELVCLVFLSGGCMATQYQMQIKKMDELAGNIAESVGGMVVANPDVHKTPPLNSPNKSSTSPRKDFFGNNIPARTNQVVVSSENYTLNSPNAQFNPKIDDGFLQPQSLPSGVPSSSSEYEWKISESVVAVLQAELDVWKLLGVNDCIAFIYWYASNSASYCSTLQNLYEYWKRNLEENAYIKLYMYSISNKHPSEVWIDCRDNYYPKICNGVEVVKKAESLYSLMQECERK